MDNLIKAKRKNALASKEEVEDFIRHLRYRESRGGLLKSDLQKLKWTRLHKPEKQEPQNFRVTKSTFFKDGYNGIVHMALGDEFKKLLRLVKKETIESVKILGFETLEHNIFTDTDIFNQYGKNVVVKTFDKVLVEMVSIIQSRSSIFQDFCCQIWYTEIKGVMYYIRMYYEEYRKEWRINARKKDGQQRCFEGHRIML